MKIIFCSAILLFAVSALGFDDKIAQDTESEPKATRIVSPEQGKIELKALAECNKAMNFNSHLAHLNKNICPSNWISPAKLPEKFQKLYRLYEDRVEVYDLTDVPFRAGKDSRSYTIKEKNRTTSQYWPFSIPSPSASTDSGLYCALYPDSDARKYEITVTQISPSETFTNREQAEKVTEALRDGIWPQMAESFLRQWKYKQEPGEYPLSDRKTFETDFKNVICKCHEANVIDSNLRETIIESIKNPDKKYHYSPVDIEKLRKMISQLPCPDLVS
jgi:hypothetical protein